MKNLFEKVDSFHLADIKNPMHPSVFIEEALYDILILALPYRRESILKVESHAFVFDHESYYYFDREKVQFVDIKSIQFVYEFLNEKTNHLMDIVALMHESIDMMEEKLYDNARFSNFMHYWLANKKDLNRINRVLNLDVEVLNSFITTYLKEEDFLAIHFQDIHEHLSRTNRSVSSATEKLNNLYNFYTSRNNEKMNRTIYLLTILSGIFLPLHFVAGYFGMNSQGLPFSDVTYGTTLVTLIMVSCAVIMGSLILFFKKRL